MNRFRALALTWLLLLSAFVAYSEKDDFGHKAAPTAAARGALWASCANAPSSVIPAAGQFGLTCSWGVIQSSYTNESNLLDGQTPVADTDLMLPYAAQERVSLPGDARDRYTVTQTSYISGSGLYDTFTTPNGGRFALLHLHESRVIRGHTYTGGATVGTSGWPTAYEYSNWSCSDYVSCESDSHLCSISSSLALRYFSLLAQGKAHPSPKFDYRLWNAYRVGHHERVISPWYHRHLSWAASVWRHHHWLRGIRYQTKWHAHGGYDITGFSRGYLRCWPRYGACKASNR